jgi:hypothetical protein
MLRGLLNLATSNAGSAHADTLGRTVHNGVHGLQIQVPAPLGDIMRVTDPIAEPWTPPANFTYFRHGDFAPWMEFSVYQLRVCTRNRSHPS